MNKSRRPGLLYAVLGGLTIATIPCYCTAMVLIAIHPTPTPTLTPTLAPNATATRSFLTPAVKTTAPPIQPQSSLTPTNTAYVPPTATITPTPTPTSTETQPPPPTHVPTSTATPTWTPIPSSTETPVTPTEITP